MRRGSQLYGTAVRLLATPGRRKDAEEALSGSLRSLRSAMNWLEDTPDFETAHQRLDGAGGLQRRHFPKNCRLTFKDDAYFQECPVALAHNRVGLSVGAVIRESECSICHRDPDDCPHISGRVYDGDVCVRIIKRFDVDEVSFVGRPNMPDARIQSMWVEMAELREALGDSFRDGMDVFCDRCLKPCHGVKRPFEGVRHTPRSPGRSFWRA